MLTRRCRVCERDLPATRDFWRWRDDGADLPKGKICHACILDRIKARHDNPEYRASQKVYRREHMKRPGMLKRQREYQQRYRQSDKGKAKEKQCRRATTDRRTLEYRQARRAQQQSVVTLVAYLDRSQRLADALGIDVHELDQRNFGEG